MIKTEVICQSQPSHPPRTQGVITILFLALDLGKFNPTGCYFDTETRQAEYVPAVTDLLYRPRLLWSRPVDFVVMEACGRLRARDSAASAIARTLSIIIDTMIKTGCAYKDIGAEAYNHRFYEKQLASLRRRVQKMGYDLQPSEAA